MAVDVAEALNVNIREQLKLYSKWEAEPASANYLSDLKKLIGLTEGALKTAGADEKQTIINNIHSNFSPEFNTWIGAKFEDAQVNSDISDAIFYYNSLLAEKSNFEADLKKTVATLEGLLVESNLKKKEEEFLGLTKTFSPEFEKYLKDTALPGVNAQLQKTVTFFGKVLEESDVKFAKEIKELKAKTEAALADSVSVDDKNKVLQEVTVTGNQDLNEYLQKKNIEYA